MNKFIVIILIISLSIAVTNSKIPKGKLKGHLTFKQVFDWMENQVVSKFPNYAITYDIGRSVQNRPIRVLCLGEDCFRQRYEIHPIIGETHYNSLHHAREPLGMMTLIVFIDDLLSQIKLKNFTIINLLRTRRLDFVLVVNPDGYVANEKNKHNGLKRKNFGIHSNDTCQNIQPYLKDLLLYQQNNSYKIMKTEIGVDLNRNYDFCFGIDVKGSSTNPCSLDYHGPFPFSEPETQAIKYLIENRFYGVAFNYHAFGKEILLPYSCDNTILKSEDFTFDQIQIMNFYKQYADRLTKGNGYTYGQYWNENRNLKKYVNGDCADWMFHTKNIIAVSPEVAPLRKTISKMNNEDDEFDNGYYIPESEIIANAKELIYMNYIGAWTSGCFLEISSVKYYENMLTIQLRNWGLLQSRGLLLCKLITFPDNDFDVWNFKIDFLQNFDNNLKIRGENFIEMKMPYILNSNFLNSLLIIQEDDYCLIYSIVDNYKNNLVQLHFQHRCAPFDPPCLRYSEKLK